MTFARDQTTVPAPSERQRTFLVRLRQHGRYLRQLAASPVDDTRRRLAVVNLVVVSLIVLLMASAVYVVEAHAIDQQINQELVDRAARASADNLAAAVRLPNSLAPTSNDESQDVSTSAERYEPSSPNVFVLAMNTHGRVFVDPGHVSAYGLPDVGVAQAVLRGQATNSLATVGHDPHEYRLYTVSIRENGHIIGALQVGTSLDARERQLHDLLFTLAVVGIGVLALTAGASLYLAERALVPTRRAFARQRQFAGAASHELRTPLAIVRSQAELVQRRLGRMETSISRPTAIATITDTALTGLIEDVQEIVDEVDYMTRLVHDLILLARDEHDTGGIAWELVDLGTLVLEVTSKLRETATAHNLTLDVQIPAESVAAAVVHGDADRLRQLVLIFLDNALTYTPAGGTVRVTVQSHAGKRLLAGHHGHAELRIADTGAGIAPEHLARIFEPFFRTVSRLGDTLDTKHHGAGLGLALARWIVMAHGGTLAVSSTRGTGSVFTVSLPLADG